MKKALKKQAKEQGQEPQRVPQFAESRGELAQALGVSLQSVQTYHAEGAPRRTDQGYDVEAWRQWRLEHKSGHLPRVPSSADAVEDKDRLLRAQADEREEKALLAKLEREELEGELIRKAEVKDRDIARVHAVKRGLLAFERALPPKLVGLNEREMRAVLAKELRLLLERFQRM